MDNKIELSEILSKYIKAFTKLRVAPTNGGAPHKPILLLSVLQLVKDGQIRDRRVEISPELVATFRANWKILVHTKHDCIMSLPFFHLKTEGFWQLVPKSGGLDVNRLSSFTKSLIRLSEAIEFALLDNDLFTLMQDTEGNRLLQTALLDRYFPASDISKHDPKEGQLEIFDSVGHMLLNEDPAEYRKQVMSLIEQNDDEEVFLRGGVFKREVPKLYEYKCAISEMRVDAIGNVSMVDACHIVPFSESHDDTISNGIALCPTLHRAFDRGLISISSDYRVLVSNDFKEDPGEYGIRKFNGKPLLLPDSQKFFPRQENLQWHRDRFGFA